MSLALPLLVVQSWPNTAYMSIYQDEQTPDPLPVATAKGAVWYPAAVAALLGELDQEEIDSGSWHPDFLTLGHRLRVNYGNTLTLRAETPAYAIACAGGVEVTVACQVEREHAETVQITALIGQLGPKAGATSLALRINAELMIARISLRGEVLWSECELPFCAAHTPALAAAVPAVALAARRLREVPLGY